MKIDLHRHSKYSNDNYLEPDDLIRQAIIMKLDGVCFTEHHSIFDKWVSAVFDMAEEIKKGNCREMINGEWSIVIPS